MVYKLHNMITDIYPQICKLYVNVFFVEQQNLSVHLLWKWSKRGREKAFLGRKFSLKILIFFSRVNSVARFYTFRVGSKQPT